ncbi:MoaD/ThiS family protein [Kitasatospora sp. NPDC059088]|uniref:MoaD/ThiS family protein n=1 Tax=Kitasatospora sp. NPDC059088 TaxID=3346722 RepID=UPI0036BB4B63
MIFKFNDTLLRATDNQRTVTIQAATLADALTKLTTKFPQLKSPLLDNGGQLRQTQRISFNGMPIDQPAMSLPLSDADSIEFLAPIAGG